MGFIDIGKEYREKVNAFNATSFYGASQAQIQKNEQTRTETRSAGGLNDTAHDAKYWEIENPTRSVSADQTYLNNYGIWNTKYKEKEVNKLQYIQQPNYDYEKVSNRWVEHLEEIEANRVSNVKPAFNGNGNMTLEVDRNA